MCIAFNHQFPFWDWSYKYTSPGTQRSMQGNAAVLFAYWMTGSNLGAHHQGTTKEMSSLAFAPGSRDESFLCTRQ